jgi:hypothetical protein
MRGRGRQAAIHGGEGRGTELRGLSSYARLMSRSHSQYVESNDTAPLTARVSSSRCVHPPSFFGQKWAYRVPVIKGLLSRVNVEAISDLILAHNPPVDNHLLSTQPSLGVPIISLPGITLPVLPLDRRVDWFHRIQKKPCYRSQNRFFFPCPITGHYWKRPQRSVANGAGLVFPDNRNTLVYRKISAWCGYSFARCHCCCIDETKGFLRQRPALITHHVRIAWRRARSCATYSLLSEVPSTLSRGQPL